MLQSQIFARLSGIRWFLNVLILTNSFVTKKDDECFIRIKGGGGGNGYFFVKLDFEIAVDQQTKTSDRTFEGVPDPNRQTVPAGQPRPYLVQIRPNLAKYPEHAPCGHMNSYMKFHQDWTKNN